MEETNPGVKPDLSNASLSGVKLPYNLNLAEADISNSDLSDSKLIMVDLTRSNLSKTDLCRADLSTASLAGANLSQAFLFGATLIDADLSKANLSKTNLSRANLTGVDLAKATLMGANLFETNLWEANLDTANLSGANLCGANLTEANLSGAIFHQTHIGYTSFVNVNLGDVQNIDTTKHIGPSYVSISTIFNSGRDVSRAFLRGCGIPEIFIKSLPAFAGTPIQFSSCFISFSSSDRLFAVRLHELLQGKGIRCWLDEHQARPKDDAVQRIERGISKRDRIVLCCSEASLNSWWIESVVAKTLKKEKQLVQAGAGRGRLLVPVDLDGCLSAGQWRSDAKDEVLSRLAADFTGWEADNERFDEQFERVVISLRTDGGDGEVSPKRMLQPGSPPSL